MQMKMIILWKKRGRYDKSALLKDKILITSQIVTYNNPAISNYRREHAPHRLYLPSDHNQYHNNIKTPLFIFLRSLPKTIKSHNISFAALGNEECESCDMHVGEFNKAPNTSCATCNNHVEHRQRYRDSRKAYKLDKTKVEEHKDKDTVYVCVDLQKVVVLPYATK